jgi:hypothetical protein
MLSGMNEPAFPYLIVILSKTVKLAKRTEKATACFVSEGCCYRDCGFGDFTEFYDWLRNSRDEILGVRYYLCADTEFLIGYSQVKDYMLSRGFGTFSYVEIYFTEKRDVDPLRSCDQGFVYDPVFRSDDGEIAIAFDTGWLSESELLMLEGLTPLWTDVHDCV